MQPTHTIQKDFHKYFPVSTSLMAEAVRQSVRDFYGYAWTMEDICDNPALPREEKRQQLRLLRVTLQEHNTELLPDWALGYQILLDQGRLSPLHGEHLWQAAWQDTEQDRYLTMEEVLAHVRLAAVPIGRGVMEITGEKEVDRAAADALCIALMLIDILQNARADYLLRQRVYLPQHWLEEAGVSDKVLTKKETGPKLRLLFNDWLDEVESQLTRAAFLPGSLQQRRLRGEIKSILATTRELTRKLRRSDPMAGKIRLTGSERFFAGLGALFK